MTDNKRAKNVVSLQPESVREFAGRRGGGKGVERKLQKNALPIAYVRKKSYLCSGNAKNASEDDKKMLKSRKIRMIS